MSLIRLCLKPECDAIRSARDKYAVWSRARLARRSRETPGAARPHYGASSYIGHGVAVGGAAETGVRRIEVFDEVQLNSKELPNNRTRPKTCLYRLCECLLELDRTVRPGTAIGFRDPWLGALGQMLFVWGARN